MNFFYIFNSISRVVYKNGFIPKTTFTWSRQQWSLIFWLVTSEGLVESVRYGGCRWVRHRRDPIRGRRLLLVQVVFVEFGLRHAFVLDKSNLEIGIVLIFLNSLIVSYYFYLIGDHTNNAWHFSTPLPRPLCDIIFLK